MTALVNDVHSRLNATAVDEIVPLRSPDEIAAALARARAAGKPVSIAGGRHAMGGQQFCAGGDPARHPPARPRALARPRARHDRGRGRASSGRRWRGARGAPLGLRAEADRCRRPLPRRRDLRERPRPRAHAAAARRRRRESRRRRPRTACPHVLAHRASRPLRARLRRLRALRRRLLGRAAARSPRRKVERVVELRTPTSWTRPSRSGSRPASSTATSSSPSTPHRPTSCAAASSRATDPCRTTRPCRADHELSPEDWTRAPPPRPPDKTLAYEPTRSTTSRPSGQVYLSDRHQLATYVAGYHWDGPSEMISELYVPRDAARRLPGGGRT